MLLAKKSAGLSRPEIRDSLNLPPGGELTRNLDIASATPFDRGANTRNEISYWPDRQLTRIPRSAARAVHRGASRRLQATREYLARYGKPLALYSNRRAGSDRAESRGLKV